MSAQDRWKSMVPRAGQVAIMSAERLTESPSGETRVTGLRSITVLGATWLVVIALTPVLRFVSVTVDSRIPILIVGLSAVTLLGRRVARPFGGPWWALGAVLVLIAGFVAGQQSDLLSSVQVSIEFAVVVGILPFVFRHFVVTERNWLRNAVTGFVTVQTTSAAAGLLQVWLGLSYSGFAANQGRANGLAGHPNVLGLMSTIAILVLASSLKGRRGGRAMLIFLAAAVNGTALLATGSLSNLLALAAGVVVLLIASRTTIKTTLATVGVIIVAIPVLELLGIGITTFTAGVESRIDVVSGQTGEQGSLEIRQQTWDAAWDRIQADPLLGAGLDSTNQAVYGSTVVHNYLLHYWYQGGLSLFLFAVIVTSILVGVVGRAVIRGRDAAQAAIVASIVAFAVTSAFYDQVHYWIPLIVAVAACGPSFGPTGGGPLSPGQRSQISSRSNAN